MKTELSLRRHWRTAALLSGIALLGVGGHAVGQESDQAYCERQEGVAKTVCLRDLKSAPAKPATAPAATPAPAAATAGSDADRAYCERQEGVAKTVCLRDLKATPASAQPADAVAAPTGGALYKVVDGYHVDAQTLKGFQTWRSAACDRCHGPNQEGLVGPSLVNSLKTLTKDDFIKTVTNGRLEKGMPSFSTNPTVMANINLLYAYLKGRSDGAITKAHVEPIE